MSFHSPTPRLGKIALSGGLKAYQTADQIERDLELSAYDAAAYERVAAILKTAADRIAEELHLSLTERAETLAGMIDGAEYHLQSALLHAHIREAGR